jgi:hypothetical protein
LLFQLDGAHPSIKAHTHIVQFNVNKNANLPFHLLSWGQHFVRKHNCEFSLNDNHTAHSRIKRNSSSILSHSRPSQGRSISEHRKDYLVDRLAPDNVLLKICEKKGVATAKGTPVNVTYHRPSDVYLQQTSKSETTINEVEYTVDEKGKITKKTKNENNNLRVKFHNVPFEYIYYTESDQILRYGSPTAMEMLVSATNETTLLAGRRRHKDAMSNASEYMTGKSSLCYAMLCYVMLCYVMLCYVMLCYVMLCYVMLCYVMFCYVMLCHVMLCYVMLCYVMLCYVMLCYVMLCCVMLYNVMLHYVMLRYVMLCYVMLSCVMLYAK